ncbi:hypothetical protein [Bradyrhizobium sp. 137]|uniref:HoxN/HupN/NixA family nickel/cobalt transporter n=1 Tax=Bradyrhizobium sp. 137 TaxID=2782614 RepID=UPI001FFB89D4
MTVALFVSGVEAFGLIGQRFDLDGALRTQIEGLNASLVSFVVVIALFAIVWLVSVLAYRVAFERAKPVFWNVSMSSWHELAAWVGDAVPCRQSAHALHALTAAALGCRMRAFCTSCRRPKGDPPRWGREAVKRLPRRLTKPAWTTRLLVFCRSGLRAGACRARPAPRAGALLEGVPGLIAA